MFNKICVLVVDKLVDDMDIGLGLFELMLVVWFVFVFLWLVGWEMVGGLLFLLLDFLLLGGLGWWLFWILLVCRRLRWCFGYFEYVGVLGYELELYLGFLML